MTTIHPTIMEAMKPFLEPVRVEEIQEPEEINQIKDLLKMAETLLNDKKILIGCLKRIAELVKNLHPESTAEVIIDDIIDTMGKLS